MSTIISRTVGSLRANGRPDDNALADELLAWATGLRETSIRLLDCYRQQHLTMRKMINVMQIRCPHHEWCLGATNDENNPATWGPEDTIHCHGCGHTVCDERAFAFGKRVRQGDYHLYSKANGRRFGLSVDLKKRLGSKLQVKELSDADILKETVRIGSEGAGKGKATDHPGQDGERGAIDNDRSGECEGRAVEEGRGDAG